MARKIKTQATPVATAAANATGSDTINRVPTATERAWAHMQEAADELFAVYGTPSFVRSVVAHVMGFATAFAAGYVGGIYVIVASAIVTAVTGWALLGILSTVIGIVMVLYTATKCGEVVYDVISSRAIERAAIRTWHSVRSVFTRRHIVEA